jgi:hypothetical protein
VRRTTSVLDFLPMGRKKPDPFEQYAHLSGGIIPGQKTSRPRQDPTLTRRNLLNRPQSIARRKREAEERKKLPPPRLLPPPRKNAVPYEAPTWDLPEPRPSRNGKRSWDLPRPGQYVIPDIPHGIYPRKPLPPPKPGDKPKKGTYVPPPPNLNKPNKIELWWLK